MRITEKDKIRFFKHVHKTEDCWLWISALNHTNWGYGVFWFNKQQGYAHRFSWISHNGLIPQGKLVLHKCDVWFCVNPDHLFLGSYSENMHDLSHKNKHHMQKNEYCINGHPFNSENTRIEHYKGGTQRRCITCYRIRNAKWMRKMREEKRLK